MTVSRENKRVEPRGRIIPLRLKVMAAFLITAAAPLFVLSLADYIQLTSLGSRLAERGQVVLETRAREQLLLMIETASELAKRERIAVNYALLYQQSLSEEVTVNGKPGGPAGERKLEEGFALLDDRSPDLIYRQFTIWKDGGLVARPQADSSWPGKDLRSTDWYRNVLNDKRHIMRGQAADETDNKVMLMLALPVLDRNGNAVGVTGMEILPQRVIDMSHLPENWGPATRLFLVNVERALGNKVEVIAIQEGDWSRPASVEELRSDDQAQFEKLLEAIRAGQTGVMEMPYRGKRSFWAFGATGRAGSAILFILPREAVIKEATEVEKYVYTEVERQLIVSGVLAFIILFSVVMLAWYSSHQLTGPLRRLMAATTAIGEGDFSARVNIATRDELEVLGETFNRMIPALQERVKIKESLAVANNVQAHLLPKEPLFLPPMEVSGKAEYCDEIGGDYFDYFEIVQNGKRLLVMSIGDVTGHGIPSALLMATVRALMHSHVERRAEEDTLGDVLSHLNNQLVRDSTGGRFMTLFCLVVAPDSGRMVWSSAGHDPALVYRAVTGKVEELNGAGLALGIMADRVYENFTGELLPGDVILLGTDGIWEAKNPADEMFGKERLEEILCENAVRSAEEIRDRILEAVRNFQAGAVQADDITVVVARKTA